MEFRNLTDLGSDLELRGEGDGRTLVGIAVPWNRPTRINEQLTEEFLQGAFDRQLKAPDRIPLAREHLPHGGKLIGRVLALRNDSKGLYVEARVSPTVIGDETLALLADGALDHWSIGFRDTKNNRTPQGVMQRVKAQLTELAIVMEGAYGSHAKVASVREADARPHLEEARAVLARVPILPPLPRARA